MIEHWERFYLSLPGRISICKTFMLSQIGYLGSIIMPSDAQLKRLQDLLDKFCLGTLRVAKKRLYLPAREGGLGLINLRDYIISLQCAWIKRVTQHWGDNWRYDMKKKCYGNPLVAGAGTFGPHENPILHNICNSFETFRNKFTSIEENYKKALIFRNPLFRRGRDDGRMLCEGFFGNDFEELKKIAKLKFEDFFVRRAAKSLDELNREFQTNFTLVTYMRLHEALQFARNKFDKDTSGTTKSLDFFLKSFEKGSKPFRRILQFKEIKTWKIEGLNTVKTFCEITALTQPCNDILRTCWGDWNRNFYSNRCSEYLYKYCNNILGLNSRVCKFAQNIDAECSLCNSNKEQRPIHSETFIHVFFECTYTNKYRLDIVNRLFPELLNSNDDDKRRFWFFAALPGMEKNHDFISAVVNLTNFQIWECKLRKESLPVGIFYENLSYNIRKALKMSKYLRTELQKANFFVCRHYSDPP